MKKATLALAGFAVAALALGEISKYKEWSKSPEAYFLTAAEREQWSRLQSDEEAEKFIADYWARRDTNPSTAQNEFRDQIQRRIAAADEQFKLRRQKGSQTSQGRLLVVLGTPTRVQVSRGPEEGGVPPAGEGAGGSSAAGGGLLGDAVVTSTWIYGKDKFDPSWNVGELRARITVDAQRGVDQIVNSGQVNKVLETAAEKSVVSAGASAATAAPGSVAPAAPGVPGTASSTAVTPAAAATPAAPSAPASAAPAPPAQAPLPAAARALLEPLGKKSEESKGFFGGTFQTPSGDLFYALLLTLPAEKAPAGGSVKFGGLVKREDGTEVATFWEDASLTDVKTGTRTDKAFERSIVVPPGSYRGAFGLFAGQGESALSTAADAFTIGPPSSEFRVSPLILTSGGGLTPLTKRPNPTDPFVFGVEKPIRVEPKGIGLYTREDALWYFYTVSNPAVPESPASGAAASAATPTPGVVAPGVTPTPAAAPAPAAAKPRVMARLGVLRDGKPAFQPATAPADLQPLGGAGFYGSGSEIPLATFEPGYYTLTVNLRDLNAPKESAAFKGVDRQGDFVVLLPDGKMPPRPAAAAVKPTPRPKAKKT